MSRGKIERKTAGGVRKSLVSGAKVGRWGDSEMVCAGGWEYKY